MRCMFAVKDLRMLSHSTFSFSTDFLVERSLRDGNFLLDFKSLVTLWEMERDTGPGPYI